MTKNFIFSPLSDHYKIESLKKRLIQDTQNFSDEKPQANREIRFVKQTFKDALNDNTIIYTLEDIEGENLYGFIALSATRLNNFPALMIDYVFVPKEYRKQELENTYGQKPSTILLTEAFLLGQDLKKQLGLKYLVLYPDNEDKRLIEYYRETYGFEALKVRDHQTKKTETWMLLRL